MADYVYLYYDPGLGVAVEFSEEYQLFSIERPERAVCSNSRATIVNLMALTDAYTVGSGLLLHELSPQLISIPLAYSNNIRIGWIKDERQKLSPEADEFIAFLKIAADESSTFTASFQK